MLTKTEICLSFPAGAFFHRAPSLFVYRQILQLIHRICCMDKEARCKHCPLNQGCRYYWITGNNFEGYAGLLCPADPFEKRKYRSGEELRIQLFWIGSCEELKSVSEIVIAEMNQTLLDQFFYLKHIRHECVEEAALRTNSFILTTPVSIPDGFHSPLDYVFEMNDWYQKWYQTAFCFEYDSKNLIQEEWKNSPYIRMERTLLPTRKMAVEGYIGSVRLQQTALLSSVWREIGLGKTNCIGGGKFETGDSV